MRRLVLLATCGLVLAACALDRAELEEPGATRIDAEVGDLRVLSHHDDPVDDRWVDVVTPDPAILEEGAEFREADSRTADEGQPAEKRRLFTAQAPGRTLLVTVDCDPCGTDGHEPDAELLVWDFAVGDADDTFSAGTEYARPDVETVVEVDGFVVVVRPGSDGPARGIDVSFPDGGGLRQVAAHTPDDGADLFVDVYLATGAGVGILTFEDATGPVEYPVRIG